MAIKKYNYYRYVFVNKALKELSIWDYSQQIIDALKTYYPSNLISVEFSKSYYGFWLDGVKDDGNQRLIGKLIASTISDFDVKKSTYYYHTGTRLDSSTQIFKEDIDAKRSVDDLKDINGPKNI